MNWTKEKCGKIGEVKVKRGNKHDYLGMVLRYEGKKVLMDMTKHAKEMHEECGEHKHPKVSSAAADGLFEIDKTSEKLSDAEQEKFHKIVAKGLFLSKRACGLPFSVAVVRQYVIVMRGRFAT